MSDPDWLAINRASWNARTPVHLRSKFYDVDGFRNGRSSLQPIELERVGDVSGKRLLHLQCHFGQDTLSWARLGAEVTGIDFSEAAIGAARELARDLGIRARFIEGNVLDAPALVAGETFDVVFTSYGVLGWLPDLQAWARAAAGCVAPGGVLHLVEFHPFLWMWNDEFTEIRHRYDGRGEPIVTDEVGSYADRTAPVRLRDVGFNHGLGTVVGALVAAGLRLRSLEELDWSPYAIFPGSEEVAPGRFRMRAFGAKVPYVFALSAVRD